MGEYRSAGSLDVMPVQMRGVQALFDAGFATDDMILRVIRDVYHETGVVVDPHTASGIAAGRRLRRPHARELVFVATAHPAKFPDAIESTLHLTPDLPDDLADLKDRVERYRVVENDYEQVSAVVRSVAG